MFAILHVLDEQRGLLYLRLQQKGSPRRAMFFPFFFFFFFFFWPCPWHVEVLKPEIEPTPQEWPKLLQWCCFLNPLFHRELQDYFFKDIHNTSWKDEELEKLHQWFFWILSFNLPGENQNTNYYPSPQSQCPLKMLSAPVLLHPWPYFRTQGNERSTNVSKIYLI